MKFYTSNHELERPLLTGKVENSYWCNERWIRWKCNCRVCCIKTKNMLHSYLRDDNDDNEKRHKKVCYKTKT